MVLYLVFGIIVGSIVAAPILWLSGRLVVGAEKAQLRDAIWIAAVATTVNVALMVLVGGGIGGFGQLFIYLYLVSRYFETSWLKAGIVAVVNFIAGIVITYIVTYLISVFGI